MHHDPFPTGKVTLSTRLKGIVKHQESSPSPLLHEWDERGRSPTKRVGALYLRNDATALPIIWKSVREGAGVREG